MLYPENFEEKIGFNTIRQLLLGHCLSPVGQVFVDNLQMQTDIGRLLPELETVEEFRQILLFDEPFPAQDYYDLRAELKRLQVDGTYIELEELAQLRGFVATMTNIFVYLKVRHEDGKYPYLWSLCEEMPLQRELMAAINRVLEKKNKKNIEVFNLGTGNGVSVLELINTFEKATGVKVPYEIAPRRAGDIEQVWADASLANKELGWKAMETLEDTLKSAWKWQEKLMANKAEN